MTFFRDLLADLISKRLWPVAVALLVALVAAPVVLSKGEQSNPAAAAAAQAAAQRAQREAAAAQPVVSIAPAGAGSQRSLRALAAKDPFLQRHKPKAAKNPAAAAPGATKTPTNGGSNTGATTPGAKTPTSPTKPQPKKFATYSVDLKFGEFGAERNRTDLPRLTPLPSSSAPVVVFIGVSSDKDGPRAVFLVTSDATKFDGEGKCSPKADACTYLYMHAGESEFIDVGDGLGVSAQYILTIKKIVKTETGSAASAKAAYTRESPAGRDILRAKVAALGSMRYSLATGTVYRRSSGK